MNSASSKAPAYRPDIDGLRAVAVTSVVFYHALPGLIPSGFVGVDIFFVISGYLVGGIVYKDVLNRRFSFSEFYLRRARRILPALIALVTLVAVAGLFLFSAQEAVEFSGQSTLALLGAANFYFWRHTDYFATAASHEPLLMTWSLGVEEQFYILYPFLVFGVARFSKRVRILSTFSIAAVSFGLSLYMTVRYPISAFYMLPPRSWELLFGATLAILHHDWPVSSRLDTRTTNGLAAAALILLLASLFSFDDQTRFPGWAASLPVIATALLLQTAQSRLNTGLLSASPMVFVGRISYSWYLWHWPLMAFARRASDAAPAKSAMLCIVALSFLLAILSWRFVETPFRKHGGKPSQALFRYGMAICIALLLPMAYKITTGLPARLPKEVAVIEAARNEGRGDCLAPFGEAHIPTDEHCAPKGASVALLGDSHASALGPGLVKYAGDVGLSVLQLSKSACTPLLGMTVTSPQFPTHSDDCLRFMNSAVDRIVADPAVRTVIIAGAWPAATDENRQRGDTRQRISGFQALDEGLTNLATKLHEAKKQIILVSDVPQLTFDVPNHMIGEALPFRHFLARTMTDGRESMGLPDDRRLTASYRSTRDHLAELASSLSGVRYLDLDAQFCRANDCKFEAHGVPLYYDAFHLSAAGSRTINWSPVITASGQN